MKLKVIISLIISGLGVGWMMGLSISEVVQNVVASLIALVVAAVGVLAGLEKNGKENSGTETFVKTSVRVNVIPIALIIFGIALGGTFGIYARAHNLLGVEISTKERESMSDKEEQAHTTILFGVSVEYCENICLMEGDQLRTGMKTTENESLKILVDSLQDNELLLLKGILCDKCK